MTGPAVIVAEGAVDPAWLAATVDPLTAALPAPIGTPNRTYPVTPPVRLPSNG